MTAGSQAAGQDPRQGGRAGFRVVPLGEESEPHRVVPLPARRAAKRPGNTAACLAGVPLALTCTVGDRVPYQQSCDRDLVVQVSGVPGPSASSEGAVGPIPFAMPDVGARRQRPSVRPSRRVADHRAADGAFETEFSASSVAADTHWRSPPRPRGSISPWRQSAVGPGDQVIVPTWTFTATAEVVRYLGADPVIVDVDPSTSTSTWTRPRPA